ncbi:hypothetical protein [Dyadobacter arcticus]|uniref:Outer membrane protein beta-barrel domain-containing protein n=1 Tax=Dyadobacter arcticus TaxID=1078754 RepID=A0ABX0UD66_9BACT|nr:hypothetical protein [Dyadobacter arcticus]NIJ50956.1 hypothetical protein [Dyadobacter arcticus]
MMDPSGINNFEDQWRKALNEASEPPPPSVWQGIEARLEEDSERGLVLPLWWQSRKLWYAAASIAALLIVGAGVWFSGSDVNDQKINTIAANERGLRLKNDKQTSDAEKSSAVSPQKEERLAEGKVLENVGLVPKNTDEVATKGQTNPFKNSKEGVSIFEGGKNSFNKIDNDPDNLPSSVIRGEATRLQQIESMEQTITATLLASRPYSELDVHVQKRYVFFKPEVESENPTKLTGHKEYWAGLGLMPASFNPDLKVKEAPIGFANQTVSDKKSVSGSSEAGASYAVQTQGGMRISKHWSVELGVSYLKGNSDYQGGGYLLNANNSKSANVLENALAGLAPSSSPIATDKNYNFANTGSIYVDVSKKVSNNYQFLQLPVQAGFTINPDKKLSYSVLGGMMANFFLSNDLESASGEIITTTASDEIYRSMNWAATTGLRFNYKLSAKWKASLTGSYQKAISSGFKSNQSLDTHPYLYGVSWGVRYSF